MSNLVICNGMVRSGSTLQYNLALGVLRSQEGVIELGFVDSGSELESKLTSSLNSSKTIVKAHTYYNVSKDCNLDVRRLYIYRDIRDVAASLVKKLDLNNQELYMALDDAIDQYNIFREERGILFQKYEELFSDMDRGVRELSNYLGIELSDKDIETIVLDNSIDNVENNMTTIKKSFINRMKIKLHDFGFKRFQVYNDNLIHHNHISSTKGASGTWNGILSKETILEVEKRYFSYLRENEYVS